jgi:hypothetical protein
MSISILAHESRMSLTNGMIGPSLSDRDPGWTDCAPARAVVVKEMAGIVHPFRRRWGEG